MTSIAEAFFSSSAATQRFTKPIPTDGFSAGTDFVFFAQAFLGATTFFVAAVFFVAGAVFFADALAVVPARLAVVFVVFDLTESVAFFGADARLVVVFEVVVFLEIAMTVKIIFENDI